MSATGRPVADGDRRPRVEQDVEWRWVPGYEGIYFVTSDGRLFSFYSRGKNKAELCSIQRELVGGITRDGYRRFVLLKDGARRSVCLHILVAAAFHGARPPGLVACHLDGDASNNAVTNIRYVTQQENIDHKRIHGTALHGEGIGRAVLTEDLVRMIRADPRPTLTIARDLGVAQATIYYVRKGITWKHVQ